MSSNTAVPGVLAAALLLLLLPPPLLVQGQVDRQVYNDQQLYDAFTSKNPPVSSIGLAYMGASLARYSSQLQQWVSTNGPYLLDHSMTIYGAVQGSQPTFDFAYLGGLIQLASGTTFTLQGLSLYRMQALRAPVGLFATSPGATVIVQGCTNNQQVCWPNEAAQVYFLQVFQRPFPGANSGTFCPAGSETTCNQYTFSDIGFTVNPSPEFGTGGYAMHYLNTIINCQSYPSPVPACPTLYTDLSTNPYNCLATVYDPANFRTICPTCTCVNGCRTSCNNQALLAPAC